MPRAATPVRWKVADLVWTATALLHREHPERADFLVAEIAARAARLRPDPPAGLKPHIYSHTVANRPPSPNRARMLFATGKSRRRLFRTGDPFDPARAGAATRPAPEDVPEEYRHLIGWYDEQYSPRVATNVDPLLALRGAGRHLAGREHPDRYVRRLREEWT
jgi:hypothetical protein